MEQSEDHGQQHRGGDHHGRRGGALVFPELDRKARGHALPHKRHQVVWLSRRRVEREWSLL